MIERLLFKLEVHGSNLSGMDFIYNYSMLMQYYSQIDEG